MSLEKPYPNTYIPEVSFTSFIMREVKKYGDRPAMIDVKTGAVITFTQILDGHHRLRNGLINLGIRKGDVVGIFAPNIPEFPIVVYGTISAGATLMTIGILNKEDEVANQLNDSQCKIIFVVPEKLNIVEAAKLRCPYLKNIVVFGSAEFKTILQTKVILPEVPVNPKEDVAFHLYSSGTTGLSKAVMITHYNMLSTMAREGTKWLKEGININLGILPFYHSFGLNVFVINSVLFGIPVVCIPKFESTIFLQAIQKYKPKVLFLTPPTIYFLINEHSVESYDLSSVEKIYTGSAPLDGSSAENRLRRRLPNFKHLLQAFGMTETTGAIFIGKQGKPNTIGRGVASIMYKIVHPDTRKDLRVGEVGELCINGPVIMKGYFNRPDINDIRDGWFYTGDCGYIDEEGYVYITGRYKELIKYKGFQVPPAEIEAVLLQYSGIKDAVVIGIPNEEAGELPKAFIVKNNKNITEEEVIKYVQGKLAHYKWLRGGVEFVEEIPKSLSGKILRQVFKDKEQSLKMIEQKLPSTAKL